MNIDTIVGPLRLMVHKVPKELANNIEMTHNIYNEWGITPKQGNGIQLPYRLEVFNPYKKDH